MFGAYLIKFMSCYTLSNLTHRGQLCFCDHSLLFLALAIWHKLCPLHDICSPIPQLHGFSSGHIWMWELDYKERWALKNSFFWTVVLENTLETPLDCKEIQLVNPSGNQCWISLEGLMLKLKLQYLSHLMQRTESLEKTRMLGKINGRRRNGWQRMKWLDGMDTDWMAGHDWATRLN